MSESGANTKRAVAKKRKGCEDPSFARIVNKEVYKIKCNLHASVCEVAVAPDHRGLTISFAEEPVRGNSTTPTTSNRHDCDRGCECECHGDVEPATDDPFSKGNHFIFTALEPELDGYAIRWLGPKPERATCHDALLMKKLTSLNEDDQIKFYRAAYILLIPGSKLSYVIEAEQCYKQFMEIDFDEANHNKWLRFYNTNDLLKLCPEIVPHFVTSWRKVEQHFIYTVTRDGKVEWFGPSPYETTPNDTLVMEKFQMLNPYRRTELYPVIRLLLQKRSEEDERVVEQMTENSCLRDIYKKFIGINFGESDHSEWLLITNEKDFHFANAEIIPHFVNTSN